MPTDKLFQQYLAKRRQQLCGELSHTYITKAIEKNTVIFSHKKVLLQTDFTLVIVMILYICVQELFNPLKCSGVI